MVEQGNQLQARMHRGGIKPLKETEKAIMVQMAYDIEVAPDFGYSSSMVKNKVGTLQVWIPKSQIKDGKITD